jgi:hypothetical protein
MQDIYGRTWTCTTHLYHDLGQALQISLKTANFGIATELRRRNQTVIHLEQGSAPYLLKTADGWELHACDAQTYLAGDIDPRIISMMLEMHAKEIATPAEARAYDALVGEA